MTVRVPPVVGDRDVGIPRIEGSRVDRNGFMSIESLAPGTPVVEAYGHLVASLLLGQHGKPPSVMAVVAPQIGLGTSTTALNLALMMARTGRSTLLVDANLRHPGLHKAFGLPQAPGLAEILAGKCEPKQPVLSTRVRLLSFIPAGQTDAPAEALMGQPALKGVLGVLRQAFEVIVIDTPPLLKYPDGLHVAACVDGVLQVVASHGSSRRDQQQARRLLEMVHAHVLGTVLNR